MTMYMQRILKELRTKHKLSQEQVSATIGVSRPTYSAIEAGTQRLDTQEVQKLANLYAVSVDDLLSGHIPDIAKYKQMILTFLRMGLSVDGKIPKTKLAKLLYLADFAWFYDHTESMSGMQYRKLEYGPVPDAFFRALEELETDGKIEIDHKTDDKERTMFLVGESESNHNERITTLSKPEVKLMTAIGAKWKDKKTKDIVNFTHNQLPYALCRKEELIPYSLITQEDPGAVY
jgi:transcriptional regulator with XRE-family HTH domain